MSPPSSHADASLLPTSSSSAAQQDMHSSRPSVHWADEGGGTSASKRGILEDVRVVSPFSPSAYGFPSSGDSPPQGFLHSDGFVTDSTLTRFRVVLVRLLLEKESNGGGGTWLCSGRALPASMLPTGHHGINVVGWHPRYQCSDKSGKKEHATPMASSVATLWLLLSLLRPLLTAAVAAAVSNIEQIRGICLPPHLFHLL